MTKRTIRVLDLFCGAGGAAVGYHQAFTEAGFDVDITGVDLRPQKHYPFAMRVGDAMTWPLDGYDFIHASPPCQGYMRAQGIVSNVHPRLIAALRQRLTRRPVPWAIENVEGAPLHNAIMLCGTMFGLPLQRHRLFETTPLIGFAPYGCDHSVERYGVYGSHAERLGSGYAHHRRDRAQGKKNPPTLRGEDIGTVMGIDWMSVDEMCQAVPPAYTRWMGLQIARVLEGVQP